MLTIQVNESIQLRTYEESDAPLLFDKVEKNRPLLRQWLSWVDGTTRPEHSLEFIKRSKQSQYEQKGIALGIFKFGGELIGGMGMHDWDHMIRKAQIGYWLDKDQQGQGIMHASVKAFLRYLFQQLHLNKVELHYLPNNHKSAAVAKRLGFQIEGIIRDTYLMNGALHAMVISGLLQREWSE